MVGHYLGFVVVSFRLAPVLGQTPALGSPAEGSGLSSGFPHLLLDRFTGLRGLIWSAQPGAVGIHLPPFTEAAEGLN